MNSFRFLVFALALSGAFLALVPACHAQLNSNATTVTLNATLAERLTISATPNAVSFTLNSGSVATASAPVAITTSWLLLPTRANVVLYSWFATPAAALTDGATTPDNIPSAQVLGQVTTGTPTTYTAYSQSNTLGTASGGLKLFTQGLTATNRAASRSDNLNLEIDLTNSPQLPAGSYSGTLNLQAQAL